MSGMFGGGGFTQSLAAQANNSQERDDTPAPAPAPEPKPAPAAPDPYMLAREARKRQQFEVLSRVSRRSTILTSPRSRRPSGDYQSRRLGSAD